jgi:ribonuclease P protein component
MQRRLRLRRRVDFNQLRRRGRRWHHPMILLITRANDLEHSRFGFSASRGFGKATARNRMKRILREVIRSRLSLIEDGWDCLFVARRAANGATFAEVEVAVNQLMQRSNLLKSRPE